MKNEKKTWIFLIIIFIAVISGFLLIKNLTTTNYGKLNIMTAVMLKTEKFFNPSSIKEKSISEIRESLNKDSIRWSAKPIPFSNIKNTTIITGLNQVPVRIYTPKAGNQFPLIIYSHGGSWISGNLDTHDNICRKLSKNTNAIVISVDYRLAPENPFPAGLNDVYTVLQWVSKNAQSINGNSNRICIAGDSAGGNISAAVSQMARDKAGPNITCQVLIYPSTNILQLNSNSWSYFGTDYILTKKNFEKFISLYTPKKEDRKSSYASPLLVKDPKGLPPALIITAEFDPLRDEGEAYGNKLKETGIEVLSTRYKGVIHGFITMDTISTKADEALNEVSVYIQKQFSKNSVLFQIK